MSAQRLTDSRILAAKPTDGLRLELHDDKVTGLVLRITAVGKRTWSVVYRRRSDGLRRRLTLGPYPIVSLADARRRAQVELSRVWDGQDPVGDAKALRQRMTFSELLGLYLARHARRKLRTATQIEQRMKLHVLPHWERKAAEEITRQDVIYLLERIAGENKGPLSNRIRQLVSSVFGWAVAEGIVPANPVTGVRPRVSQVPRDRFLSEDEIRVFSQALDRGVMLERPTAILRLCLLTGQRVGEVAGIAVKEIDQQNWLWNLPKERSKNNRQHVVPIDGEARSIIKAWLARADEFNGAHLFLTTTGKPMAATHVGNALGHARNGIETAPFTAHDLRRTVVSHMARMGIDRLTIAAVVNHVGTTKAGITGSTYDHHDRLSEKRCALIAWDAEVHRIVLGQPIPNNVARLAV